MKAKIIQGRSDFSTGEKLGCDIFVFDVVSSLLPVSFNGFMSADLYHATEAKYEHKIMQDQINAANQLRGSLPTGFLIPKCDVQITIDDPTPAVFPDGLTVSRTAMFEGRTVHILSIYEDGRVLFYYGDGKTQIVSADDASRGLKTSAFFFPMKYALEKMIDPSSAVKPFAFTADEAEDLHSILLKEQQDLIQMRDSNNSKNYRDAYQPLIERINSLIKKIHTL